MTLPTDQVVPLGFVISELVTNSAKYAYPPPPAGVVMVSFGVCEGGWCLVVADSGQGYTTAQKESGGGLGTRLVDMFVRQIGAIMVTTSEAGVRHEITYRAPN